MNAAAVEVMRDLSDLCVAYGVSDEYRYFFYYSFLWISRLISMSLVSSFIRAVNYLSGGMGEISLKIFP